MYEVIPVGVKNEFEEKVDPLKYQKNTAATGGHGDELMTIKLRYKKPDEDKSMLLTHVVAYRVTPIANTSANLRFASAVAQFGMLLRNSGYKQSSSFTKAFDLASGAVGHDEEGYRKEFLHLLRQAEKLEKYGKVNKVKKDFLSAGE